MLGGSAAVADSVLEEIEALANGPKVTRIQGENRYATAAAIASELGGDVLGAAASADALTVKIGNWQLGTSGIDTNSDGRVDGDDVPLYDGSFVRLYFSDNVVNDTGPPTGQLTAAIRDTLEINGAPARLAETPIAVPNTDDCIPDKVVVNLASPLKPGDVISVIGGTKIGVKPDQRTVGAASVTVPSRPVDRTRPVISVAMIEREETGYVTITDDPLVLRDPLALKGATTPVPGAGTGLSEFGPKTTVRYEATTIIAAMIPQVRDLVETKAGVQYSADHPVYTPAVPEATDDAPVATGYATDAAATRVDESQNAASQRRIGTSSGVKPPYVPPTTGL